MMFRNNTNTSAFKLDTGCGHGEESFSVTIMIGILSSSFTKEGGVELWEEKERKLKVVGMHFSFLIC